MANTQPDGALNSGETAIEAADLDAVLDGILDGEGADLSSLVDETEDIGADVDLLMDRAYTAGRS